MKLSEMSCGNCGTVINMSALPSATRKKLMVMGLLPRTEITVVRLAPFGARRVGDAVGHSDD